MSVSPGRLFQLAFSPTILPFQRQKGMCTAQDVSTSSCAGSSRIRCTWEVRAGSLVLLMGCCFATYMRSVSHFMLIYFLTKPLCRSEPWVYWYFHTNRFGFKRSSLCFHADSTRFRTELVHFPHLKERKVKKIKNRRGMSTTVEKW